MSLETELREQAQLCIDRNERGMGADLLEWADEVAKRDYQLRTAASRIAQLERELAEAREQREVAAEAARIAAEGHADALAIGKVWFNDYDRAIARAKAAEARLGAFWFPRVVGKHEQSGKRVDYLAPFPSTQAECEKRCYELNVRDAEREWVWQPWNAAAPAEPKEDP